MSIFPYVYYMIDSYHITTDDGKISLYAGLVLSAFTFAECLSGFVWGPLSDKVGRKPILLSGLAGTGLSMIMFGFAPSLPVAILARALGGALNGNIGVINSTMRELIKSEKHKAIGVATIPVVWSLGGIAGSAIGGLLADPVRNHGWAKGTIWEQFPFLLPNLFCTAVVVTGMLIGVLFLEESHEDLRHRRDRGLEAGNWILSWFRKEQRTAKDISSEKHGFSTESYTLVRQEDSFDCPPDYRSTVSSPELSAAAAPEGPLPPAYSIDSLSRNSPSIDQVHDPRDGLDVAPSALEAGVGGRKDGYFSVFTRPVTMILVSYGLLA
jgi:MFS family permease